MNKINFVWALGLVFVLASGTSVSPMSFMNSMNLVAHAQLIPIDPIPIDPIPIAPSLVANDDFATTDEDVPITIDVMANDNLSGTGLFFVSSVTEPSNGIAEINSDNTITYTPNADFFGSDSFLYTVSDSTGLVQDSATVFVTVNPVNDLTVQSADLSGATFEGMSVELFQDGQLIGSGFTPFSATLDSGVEYVVDIANSFENIVFDHWEDGSTNPARSFTLTEDGVFTAFYQTGTEPPPTANTPPTANDDSATTQVSTPVAIDVLANDFDPDGDTILLDSFDDFSQSGGTVTRDDNGTPQDLSDDSLVYTPPGPNFGTDSFTYTISDGKGGSDTATVTVTVEPPPST